MTVFRRYYYTELDNGRLKFLVRLADEIANDTRIEKSDFIDQQCRSLVITIILDYNFIETGDALRL